MSLIDDAAVYTNVIDMRRCTKTSLVAAKSKLSRSSSGLNQSILWFDVYYVQETRHTELLTTVLLIIL